MDFTRSKKHQLSPTLKLGGILNQNCIIHVPTRPYYCIVGFFEVLKFREWLIFSFFTILFSRMGLPKAHTLQWVVGFFEGLNFTNDQHP